MKHDIREASLTLLPYEKSIRYGMDALDDAELLAIILRSGVPGQNAVETAKKVLSLSDGTLFGLYRVPRSAFLSITGIGEVKALQLQAVGAIAKRIRKSGSLERPDLSAPEKAADYCMDELAPLQQEVLHMFCLDNKCRLINECEISRGAESFSVVPVREILIRALEHRASCVILAHNHPSGDPTPSDADIHSTQTLADAMRLIGIYLQDHLIIGGHTYVSLRERGFIT
ncbi:MAG: DNA repair protein RadC [Lachnospiraceae bacterium]|nr:DNA repair protein RadC [Lachnospiraceae bacterium]